MSKLPEKLSEELRNASRGPLDSAVPWGHVSVRRERLTKWADMAAALETENEALAKQVNWLECVMKRLEKEKGDG